MVVEETNYWNKNYDRISEIHVFDEAEGMDEETLKLYLKVRVTTKDQVM